MRLILEDEGGYLYDEKKETIKVLNTVAVAILKLCDGRHSVQEIAEVIYREFDCKVPKEDIIRDVKEFLERALEEGVVILLDD